MSLKIQTFNCFGPAYAPRLVFRTKLLCDYLKESDPLDIYLFQEVWKDAHYKIIHRLFYQGQDNLEEFYFDSLTTKNKKTGMLVYFRGELHTAEYRPFSINEANILDRFRSKIGIIKGIGYLKVYREDVGDIHILNIHTHPTSSAIRISQIVEIIDFVKSLASGHILIGGDFNMEPSSIEYKLLLASISCEVVPAKNLVKGDLTSYSRKNPYAIPGLHKLVDYIFLKSDTLSFSKAFINMKKYQGYHLSDHYGVFAEVSKREKEAKIEHKLEAVRIEAIEFLTRSNRLKYRSTIDILESLL